MKTSIALAMMLSALAVSAAEPKRYTPEIHGVLTNGKSSVASNVCLRQSDSEIRNCGYADASGRFFIPSAPVRAAFAGPDAPKSDAPLTFWLETGNVLKPEKLWPIDAGVGRDVAIDLECDLSRAQRSGDAYRACTAKASKPLVVRVEIDPTPYRMVRPASPGK